MGWTCVACGRMPDKRNNDLDANREKTKGKTPKMMDRQRK